MDHHVSHLKLMVEQGQRMQRLVEDMLTLSRLESAEFQVRSEMIDMQAMLKHIVQEAQALSAGKHQFTLEFDGPNLQGSSDEIL